MSCPDCFKGSVHEHGTPTGTMETVHGLRAYVADGFQSTNASSTNKSTILYLPDAFSLKLLNNKLLADRYARDTGCRVIVPDIIPGGGMAVQVITYMDQIMQPAGFNPFKWLTRVRLAVMMMYHAIPFLMFGSAPKAYPKTLEYARAIKADLPPGAKLGVCGYCWGGYGATRLCTEAAVEGVACDQKLIDASFSAHPSFLKTPDMVVDAITTFDTPYSCAVAQNDIMFNEKKSNETEAVLREKMNQGARASHYELVLHENCKHGFAVRAHPDSKIEQAAAETAARQAISWFNRFL